MTQTPPPEGGLGGPPSGESGPGGPPGEEDGSGNRPARCDVCGDVVESTHPWDVQTCSCGRLTLSGGPKHRRVQWTAEPGTGWTDLDESLAAEVSAEDSADDEDAGADEP